MDPFDMLYTHPGIDPIELSYEQLRASVVKPYRTRYNLSCGKAPYVLTKRIEAKSPFLDQGTITRIGDPGSSRDCSARLSKGGRFLVVVWRSSGTFNPHRVIQVYDTLRGSPCCSIGPEQLGNTESMLSYDCEERDDGSLLIAFAFQFRNHSL